MSRMPRNIPTPAGVKLPVDSIAGRINLVELATIITSAVKDKLTSTPQSGILLVKIASRAPKIAITVTKIPA